MSQKNNKVIPFVNAEEEEINPKFIMKDDLDLLGDVVQKEARREDEIKHLRYVFSRMSPHMLDVMNMEMPVVLEVALSVDPTSMTGYRPVLTRIYQTVITMQELGLLNVLEDSREGLIWKFTLGPGPIYQAMIDFLRREF